MRVDQLKFSDVEQRAKSAGCKLDLRTNSGTVYESGSHFVRQSVGEVKTYLLTLPNGEVEQCGTLWEVSDCLVKLERASR